MVALAVAGCAGPGGPDGDGRGRPLTGAERDLVAQAQERLTASCMGRHGFEYTVVTQVPEPPAELPYGNDDPAWARVHGFGVGHAEAAVAAARRQDPNRRYLLSLPEDRQAAYLAALDGDHGDPVSIPLPGGLTVHQSTRGCTAEAYQRLYGDVARWLRARTLVERLTVDSAGKVAPDPRYRAALAAWASCMTARGYPVADPAALRTLVPPATTGAPGTEEIRAAVSEAECALRTGSVSTARRLSDAYAAQGYADQREVVHEYQTLSVHALQVAQQVVGAGR